MKFIDAGLSKAISVRALAEIASPSQQMCLIERTLSKRAP
jgi:hypothetical protein